MLSLSLRELKGDCPPSQEETSDKEFTFPFQIFLPIFIRNTVVIDKLDNDSNARVSFSLHTSEFNLMFKK